MLFDLRLIALVAAMSAAVSPLAVSAEDRGGDHDHDLARELYEHGQIRSLAEVLRAVRERSAGDVVGVVLIPVGADWVYRIQVVRVDGRRSTIDVDAETAVPIEPNGRQ
ncbi:MAG: PepSY domain-containing protein [Bauldia sp.]